MDTIIFIGSKVVQFCIEPLNWVLVFLLVGLIFLLLRKPNLSKRFLILGGAIESGEIGVDWGEVSISSAAERVTKGFELIREYPQLPFIYSGFSGSISPKGVSEADAFKRLVLE